jgi:hypothetical protein
MRERTVLRQLLLRVSPSGIVKGAVSAGKSKAGVQDGGACLLYVTTFVLEISN